MKTTFGIAEARRIALAAQGFGGPRASAEAPVGWARVHRTARALGVIQIDSVNVLARAHYMPAFARLGAYDRAGFDARAFGPRRRAFFEYWAHEASLLPLELHPALRWRMKRAAAGEGVYKGVAAFGRERRDVVEAVLAEIAARGPLSAGEVAGAEGARRPGRGGWWGWSEAKVALEHLFWAGRVTTAFRRAGFERVYDLTERVIPADVLALPDLDEAEGHRVLMGHAARALGIAAETDLRDYFRLRPAPARAALAELVEAGEVLPVSVAGWTAPAFLAAGARIPRRIAARALVSPFDPLVWERARAHRLFDFHYRIEIYTPAARRVHGYYVLPFLLGDRLAGRVDLKADRAARTLTVPSAHIEEGQAAAEVAEGLAAELRLLAAWLDLDEVRVARRGEFAAILTSVLRHA